MKSCNSISQRVQAASDIQNKRFANGKTTDIFSNADPPVLLLQDEGQSLMLTAKIPNLQI